MHPETLYKLSYLEFYSKGSVKNTIGIFGLDIIDVVKKFESIMKDKEYRLFSIENTEITGIEKKNL